MTRIRSFLYRKVAKPVFFALPPDFVHARTMDGLAVAGSIPGVPPMVKKVTARRYPELHTEWRGMAFTSPVGLAAGLDKNGRTVPMMQAFGFGFSEVGSVTAEPCAGNAKPWFYRLPKTQSLVVHVGLANQGVKKIITRLEKNSLAVQKEYPTILSLARTNSREASGVEEGIADYVASAKAAKKSPAVQMIELNISCPNAYCGEAYTTPELLEKLLTAIDAVMMGKPIFIKMPLDLSWSSTKKLLDVIVRHDVTGVTMANLAKNRDEIALQDVLPDTVEGGLSGAPTRAKSTELVRKTYKAYGDKLIIIGVGGVLSAEDAYEKIRAGATFVGLVTGLIFNGPQFVEEVNSGLVALLRRDGFTHISQAVGADVKGVQ